jgi:hypothetical protein
MTLASTPNHKCYLCGRRASSGLFIAVGEQYRCKSGDSCGRRIRSQAAATRRAAVAAAKLRPRRVVTQK